jgi:hypothetical protein
LSSIYLRIKTAKPRVSRHPVLTFARLQQIVDHLAWQAMTYAVGCEAVAVKKREALKRAKPEETSRVPDYAIDVVVRKPVCRGVGLDRKPFRLDWLTQYQQ